MTEEQFQLWKANQINQAFDSLFTYVSVHVHALKRGIERQEQVVKEDKEKLTKSELVISKQARS